MNKTADGNSLTAAHMAVFQHRERQSAGKEIQFLPKILLSFMQSM